MSLLGALSLITRNLPHKCESHSGVVPRALAMIIDLFICKIIAFVIILFLSYLNIIQINNLLSHLYSFYLEVEGWKMTDLKNIYLSADNTKYLISLFITFTLYCAFFKVSKERCTPGKSIFKIIVVNHDGSGLNIGKAMLRSSLVFISFLILPIGIISFFIALYSKEKISLHDRICDTRVVKFH